MTDADVILAKLRSIPNLDVHDGHVADSDDDRKTIAAPLPYVVFYSLQRVPLGTSLAGTAELRLRSFQVTYVGETRAQAELVSDDTRDALDGAWLELGGRLHMVRLTDDSLDARRDDTWTRPSGAPLFTGADRYDLST